METLKFMFSSSVANSESSESDSPSLTSDDLANNSLEHQLPFFELDDLFNLDEQNLNNGSYMQDHEYCLQENRMTPFEENFDFSTIDSNLLDIFDSATMESLSNPQANLGEANFVSDFSSGMTQGSDLPNTSGESLKKCEHMLPTNTVQGALLVFPMISQVDNDPHKPQCTILTEDEQALLAKEGINLPIDVPLTRDEERLLKMVRRKIRNKISAKVSRMKKQSYVDGLEQRVKICTQQNKELQVKVDKLQKQNLTLALQLKRLQGLLFQPQVTVIARKRQIQAGGCLMVLLLSFAFFIFPNMVPWMEDHSMKPLSDPWHLSTGRKILQESNLFNRDHTEEYGTYAHSPHSFRKTQEALGDPPDEDVVPPEQSYVLVINNYNQSSHRNFDKSDL